MNHPQETAAQRLAAVEAKAGHYTDALAQAKRRRSDHEDAQRKRTADDVAGVAAYSAVDRDLDRRMRIELAAGLEDATSEQEAYEQHLAECRTLAAAEQVLLLEDEVATMQGRVDSAAAVILEAWPGMVAALTEIESALAAIATAAQQRQGVIDKHRLSVPQWGTGYSRDGSTWNFDCERFFDAFVRQFERDAAGRLALNPTALVEHAPRRRKGNKPWQRKLNLCGLL